MAEKPGPNSLLLVAMVGTNQIRAYPAWVTSTGVSLNYGNTVVTTQGIVWALQSALQPGYFFATTQFGVEPFLFATPSSPTAVPPLSYSSVTGLAQPVADSVYLAGLDDSKQLIGSMVAATCDSGCNLTMVGAPQDQTCVPRNGVMAQVSAGGQQYVFYGGAGLNENMESGVVVSNQVFPGRSPSFTLTGSIIIPSGENITTITALQAFLPPVGIPTLVAMVSDYGLQTLNVNPDGTLVLIGTPYTADDANCFTIVSFPGACYAIVGTQNQQLVSYRVDERGLGEQVATLNLPSMDANALSCSGNMVMVSGYHSADTISVGLTQVASDGTFPWGRIFTATYPAVEGLGFGPAAFYQYRS